MTLDTLAAMPTRCASGFDLAKQHPGLCVCAEASGSEWTVFVSALKRVRRADGTVHACDMRPLLEGRIRPRQISTLYRRARNDGLIVEAGHERSDDHKGKNAGRLEPYYSMGAAA